MLGRIAATLALLLTLAALAAWIVPPLLDWNRYREEIARLAAQQLGRAVRIEGPVSLSLLPQPVLTAARVSVEQRDPGTGSTLAVAQMRLRIALGALLSGRIDVRELVLRGLDLRLPWPLETSVAALRAPIWLQRTSARIEDGRVSIGDVAFTGIDSTLTTGGLTGSYEAAGVATLSGRVWRFTARATQPGGDGSVGIDGTLDGQGAAQDVGLVISGQLGGDGSFGGRVTARGPDLSQLLPAPHVAFRADGRVTVAGGLAAADNLAVEIGGSPASGAVALRISPVPRLDVALAVGRLDLNLWLPTLLHRGAPIVALGVDISAEAADLAGGTLRRVRAAFDIAGGVTEVRELRARLPGDADVQLTGTITRADVRPRFDGEARIAAPALRSTLTWAERAGMGPFSTLPSQVLRSAEIGGHTSIEAGLVSVSDIAGRIDASAVTGTIAARLGGRLAVSAALHVDRFDADAWLPAAPPTLAAVGERVRGFDFDVRLDAQRAYARGLVIAPLALDVLANGGGLTVRRLELAAADIGVNASGAILDGGRVAGGHIEVHSRQLEPLAALLPETAASWLRGTPALLRLPVKLQAAVSGPPEALSVRLVADLGDLRIEAQPTFDLPRAQWSAPVTLRHPGAPRLAEAIGLAGATAWLGDGSLAFVATLSGTPGRIAADSFDLTAGGLRASGELSLDDHGAKPLVAGHVTAESLPLPLPYPHSPAPLPIAALTGWNAAVAIQAAQVLMGNSVVLEQAAASVNLTNGLLRLDGLTGRIGGGRLAGTMSLASAVQPPALTVAGRIDGASVAGGLFETSLDLFSGILDAKVALTAEGYAPAALLATLQGTVGLTVRDGQVAGFDLPRLGTLSDADVGASLTAGKTPFNRLTSQARVRRGNIMLEDTEIEAPSGQARLTGTVDLPNASADLLIAARPARADTLDEAPEIGERLTGPVDNLRRTPQLADLAGWRARHRDAAAALP